MGWSKIIKSGFKSFLISRTACSKASAEDDLSEAKYDGLLIVLILDFSAKIKISGESEETNVSEIYLEHLALLSNEERLLLTIVKFYWVCLLNLLARITETNLGMAVNLYPGRFLIGGFP